MVLRCAWGTCNVDERYPERLLGVRLIRFPTPKGDLDKCKRWIKACCRPHDQLNVNRINQHKAVCSKHFVGKNGPTKEYPDPVSADGSISTPARKQPKRRLLTPTNDSNKRPRGVLTENTTILNSTTNTAVVDGVSTQTEENWVSAMDMLALTMENESLRSQVHAQCEEIKKLQSEVEAREKTIAELQSEKPSVFSSELVNNREKDLKDLFKYYTGLTFFRFSFLLKFLLKEEECIKYKYDRKDIRQVSPMNALFMTVCRLRHGFGLKDLATRFGLTLQSAGEIFDWWLDRIYHKLGQLSIWPHRDSIISNMPSEFKRDFPTSLVIIDGTEIRTQTPSALALHSQLYSDYKSSTTLKGLIGCDPCGNLLFVSELYTGSISDKALTEQSGFYDTIKQLKKNGFIQNGDAVMADKGFSIRKEIEELGLRLNIPPFASAGSQMSAADNALTTKIAKHRVHIERLICKVKTYKLLSNTMPTCLFHKANKIWTVCCYFTLFQDDFVREKTKDKN